MSAFKLHSEDSEFNNRVDALFSSLQTAAVDHEPQPGSKRTWEEGIGGSNAEEEDNVEESFSRIGHKFRRPEGLPPNFRGRGGRAGKTFGPRNNTPDYVKNPQNWIQYNMKDTRVLSDRENKQVGLKLFDELRSRRLEEENGDGSRNEEESGPTTKSESPKIVFKKPAKSEEMDEDIMEDETESESVDTSSADALFGGTKKFRMDEYKVGQSKPKSKSKVEGHVNEERKNRKGDSVKLNYLMYEEEEGEDDGD